MQTCAASHTDCTRLRHRLPQQPSAQCYKPALPAQGRCDFSRPRHNTVAEFVWQEALAACSGALMVSTVKTYDGIGRHVAVCVLQATVQAALALSPLDAVMSRYKSNLQDDEAVRYIGWANETLTTAVFCIIIAGSLGTLLIRIFSPMLLDQVSLRNQLCSYSRCR